MSQRNILIIVVVVVILAILGWSRGWFGGHAPEPAAPTTAPAPATTPAPATGTTPAPATGTTGQ